MAWGETALFIDTAPSVHTLFSMTTVRTHVRRGKVYFMYGALVCLPGMEGFKRLVFLLEPIRKSGLRFLLSLLL